MPPRARRPLTREQYAALATRLRQSDWSAAGLRARCAAIASTLLRRDVPPATVDAWWPGGAENPAGRGLGPWVRCYAALAGQAQATTARPVDDAALQRAVLDGIAETPVFVTCADGVTRAVHPKAFPVHLALTAIDEQMGDPSCAPLVWVERALQWVWIVTTPGPRAPFDIRQPIEAWPAATDPWLAGLQPADLLAFVQAYNRVDRDAIVFLCSAFPRQAGRAASRLSVAGFLGAAAKDRDVERISARRLFASALSEAITHDEARIEAEREAAAQRPR